MGYGVYFEQIEEKIGGLLENKVYFTEKSNKKDKLPDPICRSLWLEPSFIKASELTVSGSVSSYTALKSSMYGTSKTAASSTEITPDSILISGEDATVSFTFTGTSFASLSTMGYSSI